MAFVVFALVILMEVVGSSFPTPSNERSEDDDESSPGHPGHCGGPYTTPEGGCESLVRSTKSRLNARSLLQSQKREASLIDLTKQNINSTGNNVGFLVKPTTDVPMEVGRSQVLEAVFIECGDTIIAPDGGCPAECPFFASLAESVPDSVCKFKCVRRNDCGNANMDLDPQHNVADDEGDESRWHCRACKVPGCEICVEGPYDKCKNCAAGYYLGDGHCHTVMWPVWAAIFVIVGIVGAVLLAWYLHLRCRRVDNAEGCEQGLSFRSKKKLQQNPGMSVPGMSAISEPSLWPLSTNLHAQLVAGPGLMLHFNFQVAIMAWACVCVAAWIVFAYNTNPELLLLGLVIADSPHALCSNTIHGKQAQKDMMWAKVTFVMIVYIGSFLGAIGYSIYHYRRYLLIDVDTTSMRDFAALCTGLPCEKLMGGEKSIEDQIKEVIEDEMKKIDGGIEHMKIIGVSVCWQFRDQADAVNDLLEQEKASAYPKEATHSFKPGEDVLVDDNGFVHDVPVDGPAHNKGIRRGHQIMEVGTEPYSKDALSRAIKSGRDYEVKVKKPEAKMPPINKVFAAIDGIFGFGPDVGATQEASEAEPKANGKTLVEGLKPSNSAFVVFSTEAARNKAVEAAKMRNGFTIKECTVTVEEAPNEPDTVCWEMFSINSSRIQNRSLIGIATVLGAVVVWCCCFYLPFAYYTASFSAAHNEEPGLLRGLSFSMLVVAGNQAMYFLCNEIAYRVGFRFADDAEAFYIALYTLACFLNLVVDLMLEFWLGYNAMVGVGVHTADGKPLADLISFQEIFESYPMQKALGRRLWEYCFPATFFLPFVFEPIFAIYIPYHIMRLLLRSYAGVLGRDAQKSMEFFAPMDLARYGDLILNVMLTSLIFFFPAGQMLKLFLALIISHLFVYVYDHYRVLRCVPSFWFGSNTADECAQYILALPCAILAACVVFKGNCVGLFCLEGYWLAIACVLAFTLHVVAHLLILQHIVPKFKVEKTAEQAATLTYEEYARVTPCTWFSANPVHCLRSKHLHGHSPHCVHYEPGQERLLYRNTEIGCYFEGDHKEGIEEEWGTD